MRRLLIAAALLTAPAHADTLTWEANVPHEIIPIVGCKAAVQNTSDNEGWVRSNCDEVAFTENGNTVNIHWRVFHQGGESTTITYVMDSRPVGPAGAYVNAIGLTPASGRRASSFTVPVGDGGNNCRVYDGLLQCSGAAQGKDGVWVFVNTAKLQ